MKARIAMALAGILLSGCAALQATPPRTAAADEPVKKHDSTDCAPILTAAVSAPSAAIIAGDTTAFGTGLASIAMATGLSDYSRCLAASGP